MNLGHFPSIRFVFRSKTFHSFHYHRFRLYKTPAETVQKFLSILRVIDRLDRNPLITATSVTFWLPYVMLAGYDWWILIWHVANTQDWRKFWKRFHECFVFQSRVSTKTVAKCTVILETIYEAIGFPSTSTLFLLFMACGNPWLCLKFG